MLRSYYRHFALPAGCFAAVLLAGCGTTRSTDTARTATEQLLISDAIDRAVQAIDFQPLAGQTVFLDDARLKGVTDRNYLVSTLRQHLLASGCTIKDQRDEADFVVEARAGAVGTDRNDLLFGIPATNVPQFLPFQGVPAAIPEVPLAKRRDQRGIAKLSLFAYHRETGLPVWQSGLAVRESSSNDVWVFGAGPFEHGTVQRSKMLATRKEADRLPSKGPGRANLAQEATFTPPAELVAKHRRLPAATEVAQASPPTPPPAAAEPLAPEPFVLLDRPLQPPIPRADDARATEKPRFTARVFDTQILRRDATKTVERAPEPPHDPDLVPLPQPRFDSL